MLPLEYAGRWRTANVLVLLGVAALMMMPAVWLWPDVGEIASWFGAVDKWAHVVIFSLLSLWFAGQYATGSYWRIALWLLAFGGLIELCQYLAGHRLAEWPDMASNLAGILIGLSAGAAGAGGWSLRFERWLAARRA